MLCLHTLRADCNKRDVIRRALEELFASTRSVQIATLQSCNKLPTKPLCLHTLRADCNVPAFRRSPCGERGLLCLHTLRADCNRVTFWHPIGALSLPPHAPCRLQLQQAETITAYMEALPPHAPCRLQRWHCPNERSACSLCLHTLRADCNRRSRATRFSSGPLPPHAPCRLQPTDGDAQAPPRKLCLHTLRADCNGRNAQNCNMHFSERVLSW